jgi:hypothetical protein
VKLTYISYATPAYYGELDVLDDSMAAVGIDNCRLLRIKSLGDWQRNTQYKVAFIHEQLQGEAPGDALVWVDADARFRRAAPLFDNWPGEEVGVHYRTDELGIRLGDKAKGECLSGTVLVRNTPRVHELLERWGAHNGMRPDVWEQKNLQLALEQIPVSVRELPVDYCMIVATGRARMGEPGTGVIEHTQASRKLRSKVEPK